MPSTFTVIPLEKGIQVMLLSKCLFWIPDSLFRGDMFFGDDNRKLGCHNASSLYLIANSCLFRVC